MRDPRLDKLAKILVHYSCAIKPGEVVQLASDIIAAPLIEAVYEELIKAGANVDLRLGSEALSDIFYQTASDEQLTWTSPTLKYAYETIDARIAFWAETNTKSLSKVDPERLGKASAGRRELMNISMQRAAGPDFRWCGTLFPTQASAQDAEMSLSQYEQFVFRAGLLHLDDPIAAWQEIEKQQQKAVDYLNGVKKLHFEAANGTDLEVDVEGMKWINCCGKSNFPDGEVFSGPNLKAADGGVNGRVCFSFPAVHNGHEVEGVELIFENGRVKEAKATKNADFLQAMIDLDSGSNRVGEIAIGTNYQIQTSTKNTLFDEKIGGTFHLALGAGYPVTGNANESGLHWDMVCDLRPGGTIRADGEIISQDGAFTKEGWPSEATARLG